MDDKLKFLLTVSSEITKQKDIHEVLLVLSNITRTLLHADRASIYLHDNNRKQLWTTIAIGIDEIRIPDDIGIAGTTFQTGVLQNIPNAYEEPRFNQDTDKATGYKTKTILTCPLRSSDKKIIGVFQVINKLTPGPFDREDELLLEHIAFFAAAQIENNFLLNKLAKASEDAIYRLSYTTKFKDPETQNHIIRVSLYSKKLAELSGLNAEDQELIKLAAPMHDIGKVAIPDNILQKPEKLNPDEWETMMTHARCGYEILKGGSSKLMQMAATIALEHHEKWDGTGYPNQKKGDDISPAARIVAVADVFDALTSDRYYKKAWSYDQAADLIRDEMGRSFDPRIADLFLDALDDMIKIKEEYKDEA